MTMQWTAESKLKYLLGLAWTVVAERDADEGYTILRVAEIPSVIATGNDDSTLENDFWEALQASLEAALEFGDPINLPPGTKAPWEATPTPLRNLVVQHGTVSAFVPEPKQTSSRGAVNHAFEPAVA